MSRVAIVDGVRTPFCKMNTAFNGLSAQQLGQIVTRELLERTEIDPRLIDEVIFGNVAQPPEAANIARVIALLSGVPKTTPALTVHRNCASGLESVTLAAMKIQTQEAQCLISGGTESMSNIPFFLQKTMQEILFDLNRARNIAEKLSALKRFRLSLLAPRVGLQLGLTDPVCGLNMGQTAEVLVKEFGITREEQDRFALTSHQRAIQSKEILREEIVAVVVPPQYRQVIESDNGPRENQTFEALAKLKPFFDKYSGTVTAGNSSQVTDPLLVATAKPSL